MRSAKSRLERAHSVYQTLDVGQDAHNYRDVNDPLHTDCIAD
jgi:hypothetical protein